MRLFILTVDTIVVLMFIGSIALVLVQEARKPDTLEVSIQTHDGVALYDDYKSLQGYRDERK